MKIQQTQNLQLNSKKQSDIKQEPITTISQPNSNNVAFKGALDTATMILRFLDTNQGWGANLVDLSFMVIPRTTIDFTRGPDAGFETMRRESSGTANHSLVGVYGLAVASLFALGINKTFGIKANKMFVSDENLDLMGKSWHEQVHDKKAIDPLSGYLENIISKIKGFAPEKGVENAWKSIDSDTQKEIIKTLKEELKKEKLSDEGKKYLKALITRATGSESKLKFDGAKSDSSIDILIDNIYRVTKSFTNGNVQNAFTNAKDFGSNAFIKAMKTFSKKTSIAGMAIAVILGMSVQPFNRYLTKKKTGKDGFVGVEGRESDKTNKFKALKLAAAAAFGTMAMSTIGKPKELLSKIQFRGFTPGISQLKVVYCLTIMSRLLSARDKNELRESTIKDTLGFLNLLVLGSVVSKLVATGVEKLIKSENNALLNYSEKEHGSGFWKRTLKSNLKTRDEILHTELKKAGIATFKDGKALSFKELMKLAAEHAPIAKTKIKYLNVVQLAGYVYSGLALGIGIPKLNIAITKSMQKKAKAKEASQSKTEPQTAQASQIAQTPQSTPTDTTAQSSSAAQPTNPNEEFLATMQKPLIKFGN